MSSAVRVLHLLFKSGFLLFIYFFSALIAVAKTSKTMLNSSGESGHPCLVPNFRGNDFNFSPFGIMFAVGLSSQECKDSSISIYDKNPPESRNRRNIPQHNKSYIWQTHSKHYPQW